MENRTRFSEGPLSTLELSQDSAKEKEDFNRFCHRHFSASEKIPCFGDRITFFSQSKFTPNVHSVSLVPDDSP